MADSTTAEPPIITEPKPISEPDNSSTQPDPPQAPPPPPSSSSTPPTQNPNPNNNNTPITPPPPTVPPYAAAASFRPAPPIPSATPPQFSPIPPNSAYPVPGVLPPGVSGAPPVMMPPPPAAPGAPQPVSGSATVAPMMPYAQPGQLMRLPYAMPQMIPNAFPGVPQQIPQGALPLPGIPRYPTPYMPVVRPTFPPRTPGAVGLVPPLSRPPFPGVRAPIVPPVVRPAVVPSVAPTEKAQTTVYVGKIASTVENDFILSLLQLCGPVKSWKRAQDPSSGALKGFGFCEFEAAEGVLRALRLLSKLNIDGQELMLNVNQATREYLERYVQKKVESVKNRQDTEIEGEQAEKQEASEPGAEKNESSKLSSESSKVSSEETKKDDGDMQNKEKHEPASFGLVTDEDRKSDQEALEKLTGMIEERLKNKPLPPPPPPPPQTLADASANSTSELEKGGDLDADVIKKAEEKNEDELASDHRPSSEHERPEPSSPDRSKRDDRRSRDRERDSKREKERELERYEREREQDRAKREKEREYKIRDDERRYKAREKDWELREREKEHWRKREREREKERAQERKWEIMDQERESDDGYTKKRKYRGSDEERKRRLREKEEDLVDKLREEEEIADARRRAEEQQKQQLEALKTLARHAANGIDKSVTPGEKYIVSKDKDLNQTSDHESVQDDYNGGEVLIQNGTADESEMHQINNAPVRKLGFGLQGSGKRTAVPSVFNEDEEEDAQKEKKMRPLVPLDYSEEQQAVQPPPSEAPSSNLVAAAEFAKRISNVNAKEERPDADRERSRRHQDRSSQRDRDRHHGEGKSSRDESAKESSDRDKVRDHGTDKGKALESKKLLDAKQLIDMIPKTKDELFSYEINWNIYEEHNLHERMKPWISKKITEFLGEEEPTLVEYIVSTTHEHVKASTMLENLQSILDEEAEMFVLKMWRMLIFEIKKVETGLAFRSKA